MVRKKIVEEVKDKIKMDNLLAEIYVNANKNIKRSNKLIRNMSEILGIRKKKGSTLTDEDLLNKNSFGGTVLSKYLEASAKGNRQLLELANLVKEFQEKVSDNKDEKSNFGDKAKLFEKISKLEEKTREQSEEEFLN